MSDFHEEEKLGKAYDARLMRRLITVSAPLQVARGAGLGCWSAIVTPLELAPPWLFWKAIDRYITPTLKHLVPESVAWRGIEWICLVFLLVLISDFLASTLRFASCRGSARKPCTTCARRFSTTSSACR